MLLGMIPDKPRILEHAKEWLSKDYKNHLPQQHHRRQKIAIGSYNTEPTV